MSSRGTMPGMDRSSWVSKMKRWVPAIIIMMVIFTLSSIPSNVMPDFGKVDLSVKKLGHMLGYALLALAYLRGLGSYEPRSFLFAWLMAVVYAASDEYHQSFVPGRGARLTDVAIDAVGAFVGLLLVWRRKEMLVKPEQLAE